jgi:hypothetical protein
MNNNQDKDNRNQETQEGKIRKSLFPKSETKLNQNDFYLLFNQFSLEEREKKTHFL